MEEQEGWAGACPQWQQPLFRAQLHGPAHQSPCTPSPARVRRRKCGAEPRRGGEGRGEEGEGGEGRGAGLQHPMTGCPQASIRGHGRSQETDPGLPGGAAVEPPCHCSGTLFPNECGGQGWARLRVPQGSPSLSPPESERRGNPGQTPHWGRAGVSVGTAPTPGPSPQAAPTLHCRPAFHLTVGGTCPRPCQLLRGPPQAPRREPTGMCTRPHTLHAQPVMGDSPLAGDARHRSHPDSCAHTCTYEHIHVHVDARVSVHIYTHAHVHTCTVHMYTCTYTCTCSGKWKLSSP